MGIWGAGVTSEWGENDSEKKGGREGNVPPRPCDEKLHGELSGSYGWKGGCSAFHPGLNYVPGSKASVFTKQLQDCSAKFPHA